MAYKVEKLETKLGKGTRVSDGEDTLTQVLCRDDLVLRIKR